MTNAILGLGVFLLALTSSAEGPVQQASRGYDQPSKAILDVMLAPAIPMPLMSPTHESLLLVTWENYPSIKRVALPYLKLGGVRVEPLNHSRHDTPGGYGIPSCATKIEVITIANGKSRTVRLPEGACPQQPIWSADGLQFAFADLASKSVDLWIGESKTAAAHRVSGVQLNPMFGAELQWMPDQKNLLVKLVPKKLGLPPAEPVIPDGPSIQETAGEKGQSSTYENRDTLNSKYDEDLFDSYARSQLALVDSQNSHVTLVGKPANYLDLSPAPDSVHVLVSSVHRPYSYVTTFDHFPQDVQIWDLQSKPAKMIHEVASLPLADRVPIHGVPVGPRDFFWRANEPATLFWAEALDGGDWNVKVPARDKIMSMRAPFVGSAVEVLRTEQRFAALWWGEQKSLALLREYDHNRHWERTYQLQADDLKQKPKLIWDLSTDEKYADPGVPVLRRLSNGFSVLHQDGNALFLRGTGSSAEGDRPFLDRFELNSQTTLRLFRSEKNAYEQFLGFLGTDTTKFMTWHQSLLDPPNAFIRRLGTSSDVAKINKLTGAGEAAFASTSVAVTHFADPTPEVRAIQKRLVKYKRADGLELSFTLYTPPGYQEGQRVPTILYAYPRDFADAAQAGQVTGSQSTFTRLRQYKLLLLAGYAIIDNASFPVIGDPKKAYDNYMDQLVADAKAAVDEAVRLGVADPDRVGVTGHSHGALMTANLVAHSDLFRAGVATSGSYNKTLTPFGFQSERRSVWEASEVYLKVSPFFVADKLKTPLLILHGADDANPGTTPLQATKLYEAIRGNGGISRLVLLPHEPHWYTALESNEQLIFEMVRWFDKYVKNAGPRVTEFKK